MDATQARALLDGAGVAVSDVDVERLVTRTEGWPAGLYLAALAMNAGSPHLAVASTFSGTDRFVAEYLRSEFLDRVSRADVLFLTRASILDRMCGSLCDETVGRTGSSRVLHRLEQRNLLVIPMDRDGEWFRFHHLFRDLLHAELCAENRRWSASFICAPVVVRGEWSPGGGNRPCSTRRGRGARRSARPDAREPSLGERSSGHGAALDAVVLGQRADRRATGCRRARRVDIRPRRQRRRCRALGRGRATHDAYGNPHGREHDGRHRRLPAHADLPRRLGGDAPSTRRRRSKDSARRVPIDPRCCTQWAPRTSSAVTRISRTASSSSCRGSQEHGCSAVHSAALCRARHRRDRQGDWTSAEALASQALEIMQPELDDYWTSALPYAWAARVTAHRSDLNLARDLVVRAARLRPVLTYALPVVSAQALLELAHAYSALGDPGGARAALRQMQDVLYHRPWLGNSLGAEAAELTTDLERSRADFFGFRRSRRRSFAFSRCCRLISLWLRSASGCWCRGTRSRRKRSRSTTSSECPVVARRSRLTTSACG